MADVTITAANVRAQSGCRILSGTAGETLSPGKVLAINTSNQLILADANDSTKVNLVGYCASYGDSGDVVSYIVSGPVEAGGTLVVGTAYGASTTAGALAPMTDLGSSGDYFQELALAVTTSVMYVNVHKTNYVVP